MLSKDYQGIEIGLCIYDEAPAAIRRRIRLGGEFGCCHFQLRDAAIKSHRVVSRILAEEFDGAVEMSIYWNGAIGELSLAIEDFEEPKFFVVGQGRSDTSGAGLLSDLLPLLTLAEQSHRFICIEHGRSSDGGPEEIDEMISKAKSYWLLAFVDVNAVDASGLERHMDLLKNRTLAVGYSGRLDKDFALMATILPFLFQLPYKQRPFVIIDKSDRDVVDAMQSFVTISDALELRYV